MTLAVARDHVNAPGAVSLHSIALRDFRNLARVDLTLPRAGMALVGDNAHGKTNLLEGIYYLQLLRSVRGARAQEVVRFGAPGLKERAVFTDYAERLSARPAYIRANEADDKRLG